MVESIGLVKESIVDGVYGTTVCTVCTVCRYRDFGGVLG